MRATHIAIALVIAGAPACAADLARVTIASTSTLSDLPFFMAQSRGYFREEGVDFHSVEFDSGAKMIPALASGEIDAATGGPSAGMYNAVARGIGIRIVADKSATPPGRHAQALLVRKELVDSGRVKSVADIRGLRIASAAPGSSAMGTLNRLYKLAGVAPSDVERVYLAVPQQIAAMRNGAVDIAMPTEPVASEILKQGFAVKFMTDDEIYPGHQVAVMFMSDFIRRDRPAVARAFLRAYIRAVRAENAAIVGGKLTGPGADEFVDLVAENTVVKDKELIRSVTMSSIDNDARVNIASLREDFEVFRAEGLLEGDPKFDDAVDATIAAAAAKELAAR